MNIVLDEAFEEKAGGEKVSIGMVVRKAFDIPRERCVRLEHLLNTLSLQVIRGNSVVMLEALERISDK